MQQVNDPAALSG